MKALALCLLLVSVVAHAEPDLSSFDQAKVSFNSGHVPGAKEITRSLWMTTTVASLLDQSGSYPNGKLPGNYRQIARFETSRDSGGLLCVDATISYTDAGDGVSLGSTVHHGSISGRNGFVLVAQGDDGSCATRTSCRLIASGTLLCEQMNDDSRAVCTRSYKKGQVVSYLGYRPVHP